MNYFDSTTVFFSIFFFCNTLLFVVYIGAVHTRFSHSLGTYHFAKHLMTKLREKQPELGLTSRDVEIVALAGLCHDLGHGPFSHAFEHFTASAGIKVCIFILISVN